MNLEQFKENDNISHLWIKCSSDSERGELLNMFCRLDEYDYKHHEKNVKTASCNAIIHIDANVFYFTSDNYSDKSAVVFEIEFKTFKFRLKGLDSILEDIDKLELKNMNIFDIITQNSRYHFELRFLLTPVAVRTVHVKGVDVRMIYIFGIRVYRQGL